MVVVKETKLLLFLVATIQLFPQEANALCGNVNFTSTVTIDTGCSMISGRIDVNVQSVLFIESGDLLRSNCTVHASEQTTGPLIGRLSGDGRAFGFINLIEPPFSYKCSTEERYPEVVKLRVYPVSPECNETWTTSDFPRNVSSIGGISGVPSLSTCLYRVNSPFSRNYQIDFAPLQLEPSAFMIIKPTDHTKSATWFEGNGMTVNLTQLTLEIEANGFDILHYSPPSTEYFFATITTTDGPLLSCGPQTISFQLSSNDMAALNATYGDEFYIATEHVYDLTNVNAACRRPYPYPKFIFAIGECPFTLNVSSSPDKIFNTYTIWNHKARNNASIQRFVRYSLNITCEYNSSAQVNSKNVNPIIQPNNVASDPVSGEFDVSLQLFANDSFNAPLMANAQIIVPDYIYAKVKMDRVPASDTNFIMQIEECWATRTSSPVDSLTYPIIASSCAATNEGEDSSTKQVIRNYQPNEGSFKFQSFVWTNYTDNQQAIYVHCDISVCQNSSGECTSPTCSKKKRSINSGQYRRLSFGPVFVAESNKCDINNGMCSDKCEIKESKVICSCHGHRILTKDGKLCRNPTVIEELVSSDNIVNFVLLLNGSVFLVIAIFLALRCVRKVNKSKN